MWLLHWCTKFHIDISSRLWVIEVSNVENRTHTHTHTHTSGRQLKITFLVVLDYSEYSDTLSRFFFLNLDFFFLRKQLPQWGSKIKKWSVSGITLLYPYVFWLTENESEFRKLPSLSNLEQIAKKSSKTPKIVKKTPVSFLKSIYYYFYASWSPYTYIFIPGEHDFNIDENS